MQGLNLKEQSKKIYRIFDIERFERILLNRKFGFVIPTKWDDPYEDILFSKFMDYDEDFRNNYARNSIFGQCWTFNKDSDAMWRIYSSNKRGVKLEVNLNTLHDYLEAKGKKEGFSVLMTKVNYLRTEDIEDIIIGSRIDADFQKGLFGNWDSFNQLRLKTLSYKRLEFKHENEIRVLINTNRAINDDYYEFELNINEIIERVTLDPRLTLNEFDYIKQKFELLGYKGKIEKSKLYQVSKNIDEKLKRNGITSDLLNKYFKE